MIDRKVIGIREDAEESLLALTKDSPVSRGVLEVLLEHMNGFNESDVSMKELCDAMGMSRPYLSKAVHHLEETGFIKICKKGNKNLYIISDMFKKDLNDEEASQKIDNEDAHKLYVYLMEHSLPFGRYIVKDSMLCKLIGMTAYAIDKARDWLTSNMYIYALKLSDNSWLYSFITDGISSSLFEEAADEGQNEDFSTIVVMTPVFNDKDEAFDVEVDVRLSKQYLM